MLHMDLAHINTFYQYFVEGLLNLIRHLFFLIQNLQLLIFYMDDIKYMVTLDYFLLFYFHLPHHQN